MKSPADWHRPELLDVPLDAQIRQAGLILALGTADDEDAASAGMSWQLVPVDETSYAYFVKAPSTRLPTQERLAYFCRYLEHADPLVADDVYCEFGLAPYDAVARVADRLPMKSLRQWMTDSNVPEARKGFYGLALGLARTDADRQANSECLLTILERPGAELRAGYDGVISGYLLLAGDAGLDLIERRLLADPRAPLGDVLHALSALRFYWEYGHAISHERLAKALGCTLDRPEVAARAIVDLARWQAWELLPQVVRAGSSSEDRQLQRAVIGYLLLCPRAEAAAPLRAWRQQAPELVAEVERSLSPAPGR